MNGLANTRMNATYIEGDTAAKEINKKEQSLFVPPLTLTPLGIHHMAFQVRPSSFVELADCRDK